MKIPVLIGCPDANRNSHVYSAECDPVNLGTLHFIEIPLDLEKIAYGITHDPVTKDLYITEDRRRILRSNSNGTIVETIIDLTGESEYFFYLQFEEN